MSEYQPPPEGSVVRHYSSDNEYTADATNMVESSWRVADLRRAPDDTIIATYMYDGYDDNDDDDASPSAMEDPAQTAQPLPPTTHPVTQTPVNRIALGVAAGIIIVLCAIHSVSNSLSATSSAASATATASEASIINAAATQTAMSATEVVFAATETAWPTATSPAPGLVSATLGGPDDAFNARYGSSPQENWDNVNIGGQVVSLSIMGSLDTAQPGEVVSSDGLDRVFTVSLIWVNSPPPSLAQMRATIARFFPPNTVSLGANTSASPTEYLYRSAPLAAMFSSGAFVNDAGQPVTSGTFSEQCDTVGCTITTGQV